MSCSKGNGFPCGAYVLVDGRDLAIVRAAFLHGSSSYIFAHYKIDYVGGEHNVAVRADRVYGSRTA